MWAEKWAIMQEASGSSTGPKRRKENQLLNLKHPCWLGLGLGLSVIRKAKSMDKTS